MADDAFGHVWRGLLQVTDDPLLRAVVVDEQALEVVGEQVSDDAQGQLGLLVEERRRLLGLCACLDLLPEALQEDEIAFDVFRGCALGGGADDDAPLLDLERLEDVAQTDPLAVLEPAGDAEALAARDVDHETTRQRDLRRQSRPLRLHRVLDRLDEDVLAAADQILDLLAVAPALELGDDDLVDVEEAVLLEPDLDEGCLHAREDVVDDTLVHVARDRAALWALEVDLGDLVVLEHGDPLLADVDGDEELALRGRQRRATGRGSASLRGAAA